MKYLQNNIDNSKQLQLWKQLRGQLCMHLDRNLYWKLYSPLDGQLWKQLYGQLYNQLGKLWNTYKIILIIIGRFGISCMDIWIVRYLCICISSCIISWIGCCGIRWVIVCVIRCVISCMFGCLCSWVSNEIFTR